MSICKITATDILPLETTSFVREGVQERDDLQRLLSRNIDIVVSGALVIAEEFRRWDDSKRRIDLLAVDRTGVLVVIELKRTDDGGHMELQSIRYAAMVSNMTFSHAVEVSCVRLRPYRLEARILLDVQQVIPLPEASDYTVQVRQKAEENRALTAGNLDFSKYDLSAGEQLIRRLTKRALVFDSVKFAVTQGITPEQIATAIAPSKWFSLGGDIPAEQFWLRVEQTRGNQYEPKRYFGGDDELFRRQGHTWVLSHQWSIANISVIDQLAGKFALKIKYAKSVN